MTAKGLFIREYETMNSTHRVLHGWVIRSAVQRSMQDNLTQDKLLCSQSDTRSLKTHCVSISCGAMC